MKEATKLKPTQKTIHTIVGAQLRAGCGLPMSPAAMVSTSSATPNICRTRRGARCVAQNPIAIDGAGRPGLA